MEFILQARRNEGDENEDGWGLTTFEPDRVYSTWVASYALGRLLPQFCRESDSEGDLYLCQQMRTALSEAKSWLLQNKNTDGGWGAMKNEPSKYTSTAVALLTLFMQGEDPKEFDDSCDFLRSGQEDNLWELGREVVITREGYELPQEWFTSAFCLRAFIFFAEMNVVSLEEIDNVHTNFVDLIDANGDVRPSRAASPDLVWTIPYMLEALDKYNEFLKSKRSPYGKFLQKKAREAGERKKAEVKHLLYQQYPYPISQVFSQYEHEIDFHRRFQLTLQVYEVAIKYVAIVCLAGSIAARETLAEVQELLQEGFKKPSLGAWARLLEEILKKTL